MDTISIPTLKKILVIVIAMLLIGIPAWLPYGYYTLLRIVVSLSAIIFLFSLNRNSFSLIYSILFMATVILFNPLAPIYLEKGNWVIVDLLVALLFTISIWNQKKKN